MDILSKIPFLKSFLKSEHQAEEMALDEAKEKADRIAFHREKVRNGPVSFKTPTNGQFKRARKRLLQSETKKARRRQVQNFFASEREESVLRAKLQAAGLLPYATDFEPDQQVVLDSITWLIRRFADSKMAAADGSVEVTYDVVIQSLQSALNRWEAIVGLPQTIIPEEYELPVLVAA